MNIARFSIQRPTLIICAVLLSMIMGIFGLHKMAVDMFPDVTFPILFIQMAYPGASPLDVEKQISKPIEDEIMGLSGIDYVSSDNLDGVSVVIAQFKLGINIKDAEQQVRDRLGNIRRNLPADAEDYVIRRFDPSDQAVIRLAIQSTMDPGDLYDLIDDVVKPHFDKIEGVGLVQIQGGRKREIQVLIDKNKLQERNLSLLQVVDKIRATSKDVPIGKVDDNTKKETVIRAAGEFESLDALKKVSISFLGSDRPVLLNDVAIIQEGLVKEKTRSTLNGHAALFIDIFKQSGANTIEVVDAIKKTVPKVNEVLKSKKKEAEISIVRDLARPIRLNIEDVNESILMGIALCIVVVFLFLGSLRSTLITGFALPNSLLGAFVLMYASGFSINVMTLLALSLAVGLLIDDAIVVRENIFRRLEMGESPMIAAEKGTMEVFQAVLATSLVVIAVFGPVAFVGGIVGQFFRQFGLSIVYAMIISMLDAFTIAPMLSAYMATPSEHKKGTGPVAKVLATFDHFQTWLENRYERVLKYSIHNPKIIVLSALGIFIGSLALALLIPRTFLPTADTGEFVVNIDLSPGTSLEKANEWVENIDVQIRQLPAIALTSAVIGNSQGLTNIASIYVQLKARKERALTTTQVKSKLREVLSALQIEGTKIKIDDIDIGGGNQQPFNLVITGENLEELRTYVDKLKERMEKIPGLVDVDTNFRTGQPEFQVVFNRARSETLGISTFTAGSELRCRTEGAVPAVYREHGHEYDIRVKLADQYKDLRTQFQTTLVPNVNFNMIPLSKIAEGKETFGFSQISRRNKVRYIMIKGGLGPNASLDNIMKDSEKIMKEDLKLPTGIEYSFTGQAENFQELMQNMMIAIFLGVLFIYLVLSSLYESFITPFSILLALPMAICGAMAALFICGKSIDIFSLIGIVMLLGVVAKNSILLVDYASQQIRSGLSRNDALLMAGRTRLRPILMTSLALISGMIPIAIGLNEASAQRTSMGIAIIGGLISSTALSLILVPAAFGYVDDFNLKVKNWMRKIRGL